MERQIKWFVRNRKNAGFYKSAVGRMWVTLFRQHYYVTDRDNGAGGVNVFEYYYELALQAESGLVCHARVA